MKYLVAIALICLSSAAMAKGEETEAATRSVANSYAVLLATGKVCDIKVDDKLYRQLFHSLATRMDSPYIERVKQYTFGQAEAEYGRLKGPCTEDIRKLHDSTLALYPEQVKMLGEALSAEYP